MNYCVSSAEREASFISVIGSPHQTSNCCANGNLYINTKWMESERASALLSREYLLCTLLRLQLEGSNTQNMETLLSRAAVDQELYPQCVLSKEEQKSPTVCWCFVIIFILGFRPRPVVNVAEWLFALFLWARDEVILRCLYDRVVLCVLQLLRANPSPRGYNLTYGLHSQKAPPVVWRN
jgi:hypothetical protein